MTRKDILNNITINGCREITETRALQAMKEYANSIIENDDFKESSKLSTMQHHFLGKGEYPSEYDTPEFKRIRKECEELAVIQYIFELKEKINKENDKI